MRETDVAPRWPEKTSGSTLSPGPPLWEPSSQRSVPPQRSVLCRRLWVLQHGGRQVLPGRCSAGMQGAQERGSERALAQEVTARVGARSQGWAPSLPGARGTAQHRPSCCELGHRPLWQGEHLLAPKVMAESSISSKPTLRPPYVSHPTQILTGSVIQTLPASLLLLSNPSDAAAIGTHPHPTCTGWEVKHPHQVNAGGGLAGYNGQDQNLILDSRANSCPSARSTSATNI